MLENIIDALKKQNYLHEISQEDWLDYGFKYLLEPDTNKSISFLSMLILHSGVSKQKIIDAFDSLDINNPSSKENLDVFNKLEPDQQKTTQKIIEFLNKHPNIKNLTSDNPSISRSDWNRLVTKYTSLGKHHIVASTFIDDLSAIQRVGHDTLIESLKKRKNPPRQSKESPMLTDSPNGVKKQRQNFVDGPNSLIYPQDPNNPNNDLEQELADQGVTVKPLFPATPDKQSKNVTKLTGSGKKVTRICQVGANHSFFKYQSPTKNTSSPPMKSILAALPKLQFDKAEPLEYTATLEKIVKRQNNKRRPSIDLMGVSASDVFRAHGFQIEPKDGAKHWAHLIAHFLAAPEDIITTNPDTLLNNLVPSTSASNYNTFGMVELYIKNKLASKSTDKIHIRVEPHYSITSLIPETLEYSLTWIEGKTACSETYFFHPNSLQMFTKKMYESLNTVRRVAHAASPEARSIEGEATDIDSEDGDYNFSPNSR